MKGLKLKIAVAADHGGYELRIVIINFLTKEGYEVVDLGNVEYDAQDDYTDFAQKLALAVSSGQAERGVVICGSGVGACVTANKIKGIRASVCHDTYSAHQGVEHDNMNVLCLGARIIGSELAKELADAFLKAKFINEGKYKRRLDKLNKLDE